jgi:hypothetical protein
MREIAEAYNEFQDLLEEKARRKERITRLLALIGPWDHREVNFEESASEKAAMHAVGRTIRNAQELEEFRATLPLWQAMREYLLITKEARIGEMEEFFGHVGFAEGNRQAMESALKRHPRVFKTRKRKHEKYISLRKP